MTAAFTWGRVALGLLALLVLASAPLGAAAHESRTVADEFEFVVGFIEEPAIAGDTNGIWVRITRGDEPVEGLTGTLQAEILFGDQSREAVLTPAFGEPGVYQAVFIPTAAGDYTFHFQGEIDGVAIDETFTSSPEGFDSVAPRSEYEFPVGSAVASREVAVPWLAGGALLAAVAAGLALRRREPGRA